MTFIRPCIKNLVILILVGALFIGLAACSGGEFNQKDQTASPSENEGSQGFPTTEDEQSKEKFWSGDTDFYQTIAMVLGESQLVLVQPQTERHQLIQFDPQIFTPRKVNQITDKCNLLIQMQTRDSNQVVQVGTDGENIETLYSLPIREDSARMYSPVISPSQSFVSYVVFSGEQFYETAQFQDVEITPLDSSSPAVRLTEHGGATSSGGAWSLNGDLIAYTDYDEEGILQVFITDLNNWSETKLTNFHEKKIGASSIKWSPTGRSMAVILKNGSQMDEIWVISYTEDHYFKIDLPKGIRELGNELFWSHDGKTLLMLGVDFENPEETGLFWFDVENNHLIEYLSEERAREISSDFQTFAFLFPLTTDLSQVAFYNSMGLWQYYDAREGVLSNLSWLSGYEWGSHITVSTFVEDLFGCK